MHISHNLDTTEFNNTKVRIKVHNKMVYNNYDGSHYDATPNIVLHHKCCICNTGIELKSIQASSLNIGSSMLIHHPFVSPATHYYTAQFTVLQRFFSRNHLPSCQGSQAQ